MLLYVFLEVLLSQEKQEKTRKTRKCKDYLLSNLHYSDMSDFSVHSMGVILSKRLKRIESLEVFLIDVLPNLSVVSLPKEKYSDIPKHIKDTNLDFDDSY